MRLARDGARRLDNGPHLAAPAVRGADVHAVRVMGGNLRVGEVEGGGRTGRGGGVWDEGRMGWHNAINTQNAGQLRRSRKEQCKNCNNEPISAHTSNPSGSSLNSACPASSSSSIQRTLLLHPSSTTVEGSRPNVSVRYAYPLNSTLNASPNTALLDSLLNPALPRSNMLAPPAATAAAVNLHSKLQCYIFSMPHEPPPLINLPSRPQIQRGKARSQQRPRPAARGAQPRRIVPCTAQLQLAVASRKKVA